MDAILLFSHGSVLCGAERNLLELAERMHARGDAPIVEVGFLNYTEPTFAQAVQRCVELGATRIVIAPYFLVAGKFVVKDLPAQIDAVRAAFPSIDFVVADVIGFHESLADAILDSATGARAPESWRGTMAEAAEACRENPKCPLYGAPPCRIVTEATA
ncbi:MAG TPA: CbiX/SirB N-terminal domain-containing protein [Thermoanaerobaculia bacterium]|nr:CbiX/SirB N-terminal domain-containing protein [Thermoanaerobaculia bacterium]